MAQALQLKPYVFTGLKNKMIEKTIRALPTHGKETIKIHRIKAREFYDKEICDDKGEHTIFGQVLQYVRKGKSFKQAFC